ncbi:MAG: hypothetical protein M0019_08925 [Actinomycetota bacterium]|nr:hypothetical protein [Actinomycetota bacterium]
MGEDRATINFNLLMLWWWPHQIFGLRNPLIATFISSKGINLSLSPNNEFLAIVASPLTALFGPKVTLVSIQLILTIIAGVGTYRLARVLGATRMSLLGAGIFFEAISIIPSSFAGHLDVAMISLFPLAAAEITAYLQGRLSSRRVTISMSLFLISTGLTSIGVGVLALLFIAGIFCVTALAYGKDAVARLRKVVIRFYFLLLLYSSLLI